MEQTNIDIKGVVAICTTMSGGVATQGYVTSILKIVDRLKSSGYTTVLHTIASDTSKSIAKNLLIHDALKHEGLSGILFIDSDRSVDDSDVLSMVESGKDLIAAIVPQDLINWNNIRNAALTYAEDVSLYSGVFTIDFLDRDTVVPYNDAFEVETVSSGLMYASKKVFTTVKTSCKNYLIDSLEVNAGSEEITEYFSSSIDEETKELLSEDYNFCKKWRENSESIWAAPWVKSAKTSPQTFNGSFLHTLELASTVKKLTEESASND